MKQVLILTQLMIIALPVAGAPIDSDVARQNVQDFLKNHYSVNSSSRRASVKIPNLDEVSSSNKNYYVFNVDGGGFVIAAADDAVAPVLGYSTEGSFSEQEISDGMKAWLADCNDQIQAVMDGEAEPLVVDEKQDKAPILPLMTTKWGQGTKDGMSGYNSMCPLQGSYYSVTGCVATAMAQIMRYHQWPLESTANIPAFYTSKVGNVPALEADTFDWDNMLNAYYGTESDNQLNAVAKLMRYCGQSVRMDYSYSASGAYISDVASALSTYFGYDKNVRYMLRSDFSLIQWMDMVYSELAEGRPVLLGGVSTSGGGHAFVCDGYMSDGYFHINWGWNGVQDGYYLLSLCNASHNPTATVSGSGYGYSRSQEAIVGIQKPTENIGSLRLTGSSMTMGDVITIKLTNKNTQPYTFEYGVAVLTENGFEMLSQDTSELVSGGYVNFSFDYKQAELPEGSYNIYFVSRVQGSDTWIDSYVTYAKVDIDEDSSNVGLPTSNLAFVEGCLSTDGYAGEQQEVIVTLNNDGDREFSGKIYLFSAREGYAKPSSSNNYSDVTVPAHSSADIPLYWTPGVAGTFNVWVSTSSSSAKIIGGFQAIIQGQFNTNGYTLGSIELVGAESSQNGISLVLGPEVTVRVPITNKDTENDLVRTFDIGLFKQKVPGSTSYGYVWVDKIPVKISAGETGYITYDIKGIEPNDSLNYMIRVNYDITQSRYVQSKFFDKVGMTVRLADGTTKMMAVSEDLAVPEEVSTVDLRGVSGVKSITLNSNPNTLYLFDENAVLPEGMENANVVKGTYAEHITLADGFCFNTPINFTAGEVSYIRALKSSGNGGMAYDNGEDSFDSEKTGWETVMLPFDVQMASRNNGVCNAADSETENGIKIMQLSDIDNDEIHWEKATEMKANTPYIIEIPGDLVEGEEIVFSAYNIEVQPLETISMACGDGEFISMTQATVQDFIYVFDEEEKCFEFSQFDAEIQPFRVYVKKDLSGAIPATLNISSMGNLAEQEENNNTTGMFNIESKSSEDAPMYNLAGMRAVRRVGNFYIKGNKKYAAF